MEVVKGAEGAPALGFHEAGEFAGREREGGALDVFEELGFVAAAGDGEDEAAGACEARDGGGHDFAPGGFDGLEGVGLDDQVEAVAVARGRVDDIGDDEGAFLLREAGAGPVDGSGGDVETAGVVAAVDEFDDIVSQSAAHDDRASAGPNAAGGLGVEPGDQGGVRLAIGPWDAGEIAGGFLINAIKECREATGFRGGNDLEARRGGPRPRW